MTRLESLSPDLVAALVCADGPARRAAVVAACRHAITINALNDPLVKYVLIDISLSLRTADRVLAKLQHLQEQADEEYFECVGLDDEADGQKARAAFARARVLSSLLFAAGSDSAAVACESVYEALSSVGDRDVAVALVYKGLNDDTVEDRLQH